MKTAIIMNRAHELTRDTLAQYPTADYCATFRIALRIAWSESRAIDPRAEWEAKDGGSKYHALRDMVCFCMNRDKAETDRNGNYRPNYFEWIATTDDIEACTNEAYTRMETALANAEKRDTLPSLRAIMANACRSAARYIARQEIRHASAARRVYARDYNDEHNTNYLEFDEYGRARSLTVIDDNDSATGEPIAPNPETAYIIRDSIDRAASDDTDRAIIALLACGYTYREIAERIGHSAMYVSRHVEAIRNRYRAQDAEA